jgi:hypothetical protein
LESWQVPMLTETPIYQSLCTRLTKVRVINKFQSHLHKKSTSHYR